MAVSPSDPNVLVLGTSERPLPLDRRRQDVDADRPEGLQRDERRAGRELALRRRRARDPDDEPGRQDRRGQGRHERRRPSFAVEHRRRQDLEGAAPERPAERRGAGARGRPGRRHRHFYAVLTNGKLYRSTDGAKSFKLVVAEARHPAVGDRDHEGRPVRRRRHGHGPVSRARTARPGRRRPFTDSRGGKMVMEYAVQPTDSTNVLMTSFGVEISTDGGKTWHPALKSTTMFGPIACSARASRTSPTRSASTARSGAPTTAARPGRRCKSSSANRLGLPQRNSGGRLIRANRIEEDVRWSFEL